MNEHITDRVDSDTRWQEIGDLFVTMLNTATQQGESGNMKMFISRNRLMTHLGELVVQAYCAGIRKMDLSNGHNSDRETVVGADLVAARNYAKDKGFLL